MSAELLSDLGSLVIKSGTYTGRELGSLSDTELTNLAKRGAGTADQRDLVKAYCITRIGIAELAKRLPENLKTKHSREPDQEPPVNQDQENEAPMQIMVRKNKLGKKAQVDTGNPIGVTLPTLLCLPKLTLRNLPIYLILFILICFVYPPLAEIPGNLIGILFTATANRGIAVWTVFINSVSDALKASGYEMWSSFDAWATSSPSEWQKDDNGTPVREPYPLGKAGVYFTLGVIALNMVKGCVALTSALHFM
jgi:hypothetical protein